MVVGSPKVSNPKKNHTEFHGSPGQACKPLSVTSVMIYRSNQ